ncbi:MAG TPA: hypothetical protein VFV66_29335 [Nonomuraea sp.]|nr:hypothetical protein [Nonomuraea sp.]
MRPISTTCHKLRRIATLAVAALLALSGCTSEDDPSRARPGDCLEAESRGRKAGDFRIVGCDAPEAAYKVARRLTDSRGCGSSAYGYATSPYVRSGGWHLCLTLNARVGDCFHQEIGFPTGKASRVACGSSATYRIVRVVEGHADRELCGEEATHPVSDDLTRPVALVYPEPPLTICTGRA